MRTQRYWSSKQVWLFIIAWTAIGITWGFLISSLLQYAHADDTQECILPAFCSQIEKMQQRDYTMRLQIWNNAGCSVRDICTAADGQCEEGDIDCLTSLPDPDYNKTIIAPEIQK